SVTGGRVGTDTPGGTVIPGGSVGTETPGGSPVPPPPGSPVTPGGTSPVGVTWRHRGWAIDPAPGWWPSAVSSVSARAPPVAARTGSGIASIILTLPRMELPALSGKV